MGWGDYSSVKTFATQAKEPKFRSSAPAYTSGKLGSMSIMPTFRKAARDLQTGELD